MNEGPYSTALNAGVVVYFDTMSLAKVFLCFLAIFLAWHIMHRAFN